MVRLLKATQNLGMACWMLPRRRGCRSWTQRAPGPLADSRPGRTAWTSAGFDFGPGLARLALERIRDLSHRGWVCCFPSAGKG